MGTRRAQRLISQRYRSSALVAGWEAHRPGGQREYGPYLAGGVNVSRS